MKKTGIVSTVFLICLALQACSSPVILSDAPQQATMNALQVQLAVEQTRNADFRTTQAFISQLEWNQGKNITPSPALNSSTDTPTPAPILDTPTPEVTPTSAPPTQTETPTITASPTNTPKSEFDVTVVNEYGRTAWLDMAGRVLKLNKSVDTKTFPVGGGLHPVEWACWTSWTTPNINKSTDINISADVTLVITKNCQLSIR